MARVDLKVGYSCNDACVHCVVDDFRDALRQHKQSQDKTFAELESELRDARARCDYVIITGGEPTIRTDFVQLMQLAHDLGYAILVQSNGRRLSDRVLATELASIPRSTYCIALHGATDELHDTITRRPGSFAQTVQGIRNLCELGMPVIGKIVLSRLNYMVVPDICKQLMTLGAKSVSIAFPHAQGRARKLWEQVVPRYFEVSPFVTKGMDVCLAAGRMADAETMPFCYLPGHERFNADLNQLLEGYVQLNQYGSDSGVQNWSEVRPTIKTKFPQCRVCRFDAVCEGPWSEYADKYGGAEFQPVLGAPISSPHEVLDLSFCREFSQTYRLLP